MTHAKKRRSFVALVLPLLLTILPLWFLQREADRESQRAMVEADETWFDQTDIAARRLSEASHPRFWVSRGLRKVKNSLEWHLKNGKAPACPEAVTLEGQGWKLWGCTITASSANGRAQAIITPGFVTTGRALMTQTLSEIFHAQSSSGEKLSQEPMCSRLRTQFGLSISAIHFQPRMRGRAFAAIIDGRMGYAAWDILHQGEKPVGIVLGFMPTMETGTHSGPSRTLDAWNSRDLEPVYFHLPTGNPSPEPLARSSFQRDPDSKNLIARISSTIGILPGPQPCGDQLGLTSLPLNLLDRPLRFGNWRFRLVSLDPVCGYLGMLCQRVRPPPAGPLGQLRFVAGWASLAVWFVVLLLIAHTGTVPTPGVRIGLVLWLAGVVAVPLLMGFNAANTMLADREKTLIDGIKRDLEETLTGIDRESVRLKDAQEAACRELLGRPDLTAELRRCQLEQLPTDSVFNNLRDETQLKGLDLRAVLLFGFNNYFRYQVYDGWSRKADQMMVSILESFWGQKIASETLPIPLSEFPPAGNPARGGSVFANGMSSIGNFGMTFDRAEEKALGDTVFSMFHTRLCLEEKTWFIACLAWTQKLAYPDYLTARLARESARAGSPQFVALRYDPEPAMTIPVTAPTDLVDFARLARGGKLFKKAFIGRDQYLYVGFPCSRMFGYLLAARMPLADIEREIAGERRALHLLIGAGLILIFLMTWLLSRWLAAPIVRISHGLSRIASGDLDVTVGEAREDELGQAGASLDAMTLALRERRQLSRFVPPQVLELAAAGDPNLVVSGRKQVVTILSLDIRGFTTLSERHSPALIFQMLNCHLEAMTGVIQSEGGIIDRFIGDAIVAVFPAAIDENASHQARAVRAARVMMQTHAALIARRKAGGEFPYAIGIGLESGEVVTGVLGDPEVQLDFSVLGEAVARASDLEALSKKGCLSRIIASDNVRRNAGRECVWLPLPGHTKIFELEVPGFIFPEIAGEAASAASAVDTTETRDRSDCSPEVSELADLTALSTVASETLNSYQSQSSRDSMPKNLVKITSSWRTRFSPALLAIAILVWMLPFIMIRQSWNDLERSRYDANHMKTMLRLQDDLRFVQQNFEPAMMVSLELRYRMHLAETRTLQHVASEADEVPTADRERLFRLYLPTEIRTQLEPLRQKFPTLFWLHDVLQPSQQLSAIQHGLVRGGSVPLSISDEDFLRVGAEWCNLLLERMTGDGNQSKNFEAMDSREKLFPDVFNLEQTIGNLSRQLFPTTFAGKVRQVYIHPFLETDQSRRDEDLEHSLISGRQYYERFDKTRIINDVRQSLLGILWLAIDPGDLTLEMTLPMLSAKMERRGVELIVTANPGPAHPFVVLPTSDGLLRMAGTAFSGTSALFITLSRRLETSMTVTKDVTSVSSAKVFGVIWIFLGLFIGGRWLITGSLLASTLRIRLLAAFLVTSLPFLLCSWLILERAAEEARIRSSLDGRDRLLRDLRLADSGRKLLDGSLMTLADDLLRRSKFPMVLAAEDEQNVPDRQALLKKLYESFIQNGFRLVVINILDLVSVQRYPLRLINDQHSKAISMNEVFIEKLLSYLYRNTSGRMARTVSHSAQSAPGKISPDETVIGVEFEDFSQGMAMILGGERMSDLTLAVKSIGTWALTSAGKEFRLRHTIWHESLPVGDLQVQWDNRQSEPRQLVSLFERYPDLIPDAPLISPCQKNSLLWVGIPPLSRFFFEGQTGISMYPQYWKSPVWFELSALAANRKEPVIAESGTGWDTILMAAMPGEDFSDWVFAGELRIGKRWQALADELYTQRLLLLFILLSVLLLANRVAVRFLEPAAALVDSADRIRGGDYQARLLLERTDEFGVLAEAFNHMARSAEEGRLLGRFVPATARALAADDELSRAARSGESREVIVMFAGLAGFKTRLTTCQPGPLIIWLNRHLETMSRIIRAHGGETNKFIGDKILAVFTPANGQPLASIMTAAVEAARDMRQAFPEVSAAVAATGPGPEPQLGIGLVAGPVLAGILGTESVRLEFTVIGDTVNLASRLSDLASKEADGAILVERDLVGATVSDKSHPQRFEKLETTTVKGKTRAIEIYRLIE